LEDFLRFVPSLSWQMIGFSLENGSPKSFPRDQGAWDGIAATPALWLASDIWREQKFSWRTETKATGLTIKPGPYCICTSSGLRNEKEVVEDVRHLKRPSGMKLKNDDLPRQVQDKRKEKS